MKGIFVFLAVCTLAAEEQLRIGKLRKVDCTRKSKPGDELHMHYRGTLKSNGKQFDASYDRGEHFVFTLGAGMVIKGWDQGLQNMCPGEKKKIGYSSSLGLWRQGCWCRYTRWCHSRF